MSHHTTATLTLDVAENSHAKSDLRSPWPLQAVAASKTLQVQLKATQVQVDDANEAKARFSDPLTLSSPSLWPGGGRPRV